MGVYPQVPFKPGATFSVIFAVRNANGVAFDLTDATVTAQVRNLAHELVEQLECTVIDGPAGRVEVFRAHTATGDWPLTTGAERLLMDLRIALGGVRINSQTVEIVSTRGITQDA